MCWQYSKNKSTKVQKYKSTKVQKYKRHRPENTLLYQLVERYYPEFTTNLAEQGKYLPKYVEREFDEFLRCGRLEYGFLRVVCGDCKHEKLVAFSCKRRGFCHSCGARRMAESAALLVDDLLKGYPIRQWVLSLPIPLRLLLARNSSELSKVMSIIHRAISTHIVNKAGFSNKQAKTGGGYPYSTFRQRPQPKYPLPHAVFGRRNQQKLMGWNRLHTH
jgi:ribosomal protein S27E